MNDISNDLRLLRDFLEGRVSAHELRDAVYEWDELAHLLSYSSITPPAYLGGESLHLFLLQRNYDDFEDLLAIEGAVAWALDARGVPYSIKSDRAAMHELVLSAQPSWLDVDVAYVTEHILPHADNREGKALERWLREEFGRRFRYAEAPPRWIQSPAWPIGEAGPLVFLGQVAVSDYFHDDAAAYVFHDPSSGACESFVQTA